MSSKLRVAVIGAGFMSSMHAQIFANEPRTELVAVVDQNIDRAKELVGQLGKGVKAYASHQDLLAAEQLDLVSICTPDHLHLKPALDIAAKGVNLFVEKPIASNIEDAQKIVDACKAANFKLGIGYLLRFDPRYYAARELITSGQIGTPIHIYARRNSARTEGPKRYASTLPLALHVTVHDVDMVLWMLEGQKPVGVYAQQTDILLGSIGTQDTIAGFVRFSGGTVVNFESVWSLPGGARHMIDARMEMIGTEGSFEVQCGDSGLYAADNQTSPRIVVMNKGDIQQIGTPYEIYHKPANTFVASFVGSPSMQFINGRLLKAGSGVRFTDGKDWTLPMPFPQLAANGSTEVILGVRPEHIKLVASDQEGHEALVDLVESTGPEDNVTLSVNGQRVTAPLETGVTKSGQTVKVQIATDKVSLFDAESGTRIN